MSNYLYGTIYKNKKYSMCYTDNGDLVLINEIYKDLHYGKDSYFRFNEEDLLSLKKFVDKCYEKYKEKKSI